MRANQLQHGLTGYTENRMAKSRKKRVLQAALESLGILVLALAGMAFVAPFTYDATAHARLDAAVHRISSWGGPLVGLDLSFVRSNAFSLIHDLDREVTVEDHGVRRTSHTVGLANFISRGEVRRVRDALAWFGVPLTAGQAREAGLCRMLADLRDGEAIVIRPDAFQRGIASWYGPGFHGRTAASGEMFNMYDQTAAHKTLPLQSQVRVVSQKTGLSTVVRINDRGPYVGGRIIDMSYTSKQMLGMGDLAAVYLERLDPSALDVTCE